MQLKISVKKSVHCPIYEEEGGEPWARISDILLDVERRRVIAVVMKTESLIPLEGRVPFSRIDERDGLFYVRRTASGDKFVFPPPVSCINEIFRLKSAGGSRILDISFDSGHGRIVDVTVGGFLNKKKINIID